MNINKIIHFLAYILLAAFFTGCSLILGDDELGDDDITSLQFENPSSDLILEETEEIEVKVIDASGDTLEIYTGADFTGPWPLVTMINGTVELVIVQKDSSGNILSSIGIAYVLENGTAVIQPKLVVYPDELNLFIDGNPFQMSFVGFPLDSSQSVSWTSRDVSIAEVSTEGIITPRGIGTIIVTANFHGIATDDVTVSVIDTSVIPVPVITDPPKSDTGYTGEQSTFSVTATGTNLNYQWFLNGTLIDSANTSNYLTPVLQTSDDGNKYTVEVSNQAGSETSEVAILTVVKKVLPPEIISHPSNVDVTQGSSALFSVTAAGTDLFYQWQKNGEDIQGENASQITFSPVQITDDGAVFVCRVSNSSGLVDSDGAVLNVVENEVSPSIKAVPLSITVTEGEQASFEVEANGTNLIYQWQKDGQNIPGANASNYQTPPTVLADDKSVFRCVISNNIGTVNSLGATLTVIKLVLPPIITGEPVDVTVTEQEESSFSVTATGSDIEYQWQKDGVHLSGATDARYNFTASLEDDGITYRCIVSNSAGSDTSATVKLTVLQQIMAPVITGQPQAVAVTEGQTASFNTTATGTNLTYQWKRGVLEIPGATASSYTTPATSLADNGTIFQVVVSNSKASVTSEGAMLTVSQNVIAPNILVHPEDLMVNQGQQAPFQVTATGTDLQFQWQRNTVNIPGAVSANYQTPAVTAGDNGAKYRCVVSNSAGSKTSTEAVLTVIIPPAITVAPADQTVNEGQRATFSVTVTGTGPLSYQWQKGGVNITGARSSTYETGVLSGADNGNVYRVVITNTAGEITSRNAKLTVNVGPEITNHPESKTVNQGSSASLTVSATGSGTLTYQWKKDGYDLPGEVNASLSLTSIQPSDAGSYTVAITNIVGSVTSNAATITVVIPPSITVQPRNQTVNEGATASFSVTATGTQPLSYQWQLAWVNIPGATDSVYQTPVVTGSNNGDDYRVIITNAAGGEVSNSAVLTVNSGPAITTQPVSQNVNAGSDASFFVVATGTRPITYQWKKDGSDIPGATDSSLSLSGVQASEAGTYTVVVSNTVGSSTSEGAELTVNTAPSIETQPISKNVNAGSNTSFTVVATGTAPLSYQWKKDGVAMNGANQATLSLVNVQASDAATYTVVVSNQVDSVTSTGAVLTVIIPPVITVQPQNDTVTEGQQGNFTVTASGSTPLSYQWYKGGVLISDATSSSYTTAVTTGEDNGSVYTVVVSNAAGHDTSTAATLTVLTGPVITTHPLTQTVAEGASISIFVVASGSEPLTYQWKKGDVNLVGQTDDTLSFENFSKEDTGSYTVEVTNSVSSVTSNAAVLTFGVAPTITTQPVDDTVAAGESATFSVTAAGSEPFSYQWKKGLLIILGANSSTYITPAVAELDSGSIYSVTVSNSFGQITSSGAVLHVIKSVEIIEQPVSHSAYEGTNTSFSVVARGPGSIKFQWFKNGEVLPGKKGASLSLIDVDPTDAGSYTVEVSSKETVIESDPGILTVLSPAGP